MTLVQKSRQAMPMRKEIELIRNYTRKHPELWGAHHFLFDLPLGNEEGPIEFVIMGINPGETKHDWQTFPTTYGHVLEESSEVDFHEGHERGGSSRKWIQNVEQILGTKNVILTECFFWSSKDLKEFVVRYGKFYTSPHTKFCTRLNRHLIEYYNPLAVVFTGLSQASDVAKLYDLRFLNAVAAPITGHRLIVHYHDGKRPWLFTKHWTGSFGFSNEQKQTIKRYIASVAKFG